MPCTLPDATITDMDTDLPDRAQTELAVDKVEDEAALRPWEYIHRVLTSSSQHLVLFIKLQTTEIPAAVSGILNTNLLLRSIVIENEHWLLVGPRDQEDKFMECGAKFEERARSQDKLVFRSGNLNWGADVNQIEDEVTRAAEECSSSGWGATAKLPAQFMAGTIGGFAVWYGLNLV